MSEESAGWLIAGLGNPGSRYDGTPHNLGFEVMDLLVRRHGLNWQPVSKYKAVVAAGSAAGMKLYFMKPATYMNLSGDAVQPFMAYYKVLPSHLIVVCDDVNLPWGKLRLRENGSHGGHNGLRHIQQRLSTQQYNRLRMGCAPSGPIHDLAAYVLSPIRSEVRDTAALEIETAADCVEEILASGPAKAMARFNGWSAKNE